MKLGAFVYGAPKLAPRSRGVRGGVLDTEEAAKKLGAPTAEALLKRFQRGVYPAEFLVRVTKRKFGVRVRDLLAYLQTIQRGLIYRFDPPKLPQAPAPPSAWQSVVQESSWRSIDEGGE